MSATLHGIVYALVATYLVGVGAFGWSYICNGVFLAYDDRPAWLAIVHTLAWPVVELVAIFLEWRDGR